MDWQDIIIHDFLFKKLYFFLYLTGMTILFIS